MHGTESWSLPPKQALYDPTLERDACGVGFIVAIDGKKSHKVSVPCNFPFNESLFS